MNVVHLNPLNPGADLIFDRHDADRRRHGRPRVGPGVPARQPAVAPPARRAGAWTGTPACRSTASTWWCRRWPSSPSTSLLPYGVAFKLVAVSGLVGPAVLLLGVRAAGPLPLPDAGAVRLRRAVLRARRELQHLRRQPQVDDGRRVLVLHRAQPRHPRPRPAGQRHADRASTAAGRRSCSPWPSSATASSPSTSCWRRSSSSSSTSRTSAGSCSALSVGVAVVLLSAFWIGPFLGNHEYMTDMKYGARPEGVNDSFWDMFFPLTAPLDILVTGAGGRSASSPASAAATPTAPRSASSGCSPWPGCTPPRTACRSSGCCGTRACCR